MQASLIVRLAYTYIAVFKVCVSFMRDSTYNAGNTKKDAS